MITARNSSSFHYHSWWTLAIGLYLSTYVRRHSYVLALSPKGHSPQAMFCYDGSSHHNHITVYFDCVIISKRSRKYIRRIKITTRPLIQNHLLAGLYLFHPPIMRHTQQCGVYVNQRIPMWFISKVNGKVSSGHGWRIICVPVGSLSFYSKAIDMTSRVI